MASAQVMGAQASHPFTCNTCQVAYRTDVLQKGHMKSDWHRYNLKRRVASLPPIAAEVFTDKVLQARAVSTAEADKATFTRSCEVCQKTYYSENSFRNHLSSQRHRARQAAVDRHRIGQANGAGGAGEADSVITATFSLGDPLPSEPSRADSDVEDEFVQVVEGLRGASLVKQPENPASQQIQQGESTESAEPTESEPTKSTSNLKSCLFCNYISPTVPLNVHHMERFHGMFIPEKQYLVKLEGLLQHLHDRVQNDFQCLFCAKFKGSAYAVQTHMRDTGHCKIPYSTEAEQLDIGDFYDFRSTYSDGEDDEEEEEEGEEEGENDGWETDSSASSVASDDIGAVPADGRLVKSSSSRSAKSKHHQADGWNSRVAYYDGFELHLPSGKSVGHRSLSRYYRQNLLSHPTPEEREQRLLAIEAAPGGDGGDAAGPLTDPRLKNRVRAVVPRGTLGMVGATSHQKEVARDSERRGRSLERFRGKREDWKVSKVLNNHKSYYYRYNGGG